MTDEINFDKFGYKYCLKTVYWNMIVNEWGVDKVGMSRPCIAWECNVEVRGMLDLLFRQNLIVTLVSHHWTPFPYKFITVTKSPETTP
jgi:hypothetical protein